MKFKSHHRTSFRGPQFKSKGKTCSSKYHRIAYDNVQHMASKKVRLSLLKRSSPCSSSILRSYTEKTEYVEIVDIETESQQMHAVALRRKVDAIAHPRKIVTENSKNHSICERLRGRKDVKMPSRRSFTACTLSDSREASDSNNDACSIGSCSLENEKQNGFSEYSMLHPYQERNLLLSDSESIYPPAHKEEKRNYCLKEKAEVSVHSLELHAYRCTLEALFVSGALSWEQEELLTDLRITLHISNDEHLTELRNLIPSGTSK